MDNADKVQMNYMSIVEEWQLQPIKDISDIDLILHDFRVLFAYNSGRIENENFNYNDICSIFENGELSGYAGDVLTLNEQRNQKDCYEVLKPYIVKRQPLSVDLLKKMHFALCKDTYDENRLSKGEQPGELKKNNYGVGYLDVGSYASEVVGDLTEVLEDINSYTGDRILDAAAYLHACFENIHPFADGNGVVGRTMMNYYLMIHDHPPIVVFDEDKKLYYHALEAFDRSEELEPLLTFLTSQGEKTWGRV